MTRVRFHPCYSQSISFLKFNQFMNEISSHPLFINNFSWHFSTSFISNPYQFIKLSIVVMTRLWKNIRLSPRSKQIFFLLRYIYGLTFLSLTTVYLKWHLWIVEKVSTIEEKEWKEVVEKKGEMKKRGNRGTVPWGQAATLYNIETTSLTM